MNAVSVAPMVLDERDSAKSENSKQTVLVDLSEEEVHQAFMNDAFPMRGLAIDEIEDLKQAPKRKKGEPSGGVNSKSEVLASSTLADVLCLEDEAQRLKRLSYDTYDVYRSSMSDQEKWELIKQMGAELYSRLSS